MAILRPTDAVIPGQPCKYCAGEKPINFTEGNDAKELRKSVGKSRLKNYRSEWMFYLYYGKIEWGYDSWGLSGQSYVKQGYRQIHSKSDWIIEVHYCPDQQKKCVKAVGTLPNTMDEITGFTDFYTEAIREFEPRGRNSAISLNEIADIVRTLHPKEGWTRISVITGIPVRTLQDVLRRENMTLTKLRKKIQEESAQE